MATARSRKEEYSDKTRAALIRAGRRIFAKKGFADASLAEIVAGARVTTGALYHHFGGKVELFRAVAEAAEQEIMAAVVAAAEKVPGDDVVGQVRAGNEAMLDMACHPDIQRIAFVDAAVVLGPTVWREIETRYAYGLLHGALHALAESGQLRSVSPDVVAPMLLGALIEAAIAIAIAKDKKAAREEAGIAAGLMLDGILRERKS